MKICFLGAGALGSAIGGSLAEAGADVVLVDAWQAHVDAMTRDGLTLREGGVDRKVKVRAATGVDGIDPVDLVIVLVKSFHTREAVERARAIVSGVSEEDPCAEPEQQRPVVAAPVLRRGAAGQGRRIESKTGPHGVMTGNRGAPAGRATAGQ